VNPGYFRSDPSSPNLTAVPFYSCPYPNTCLGGNDTNGSCALGHDETGPVCAVCNPGFAFQGEKCISCPGYTGDADALPEFQAVFAVLGLIYMAGVRYFFTRPALSKDTTSVVRRRLTLSMSEFSSTVDEEKIFDKTSFFSLINNTVQDDLHLTPTEISLLFSDIDTDNNGTLTKKEIDEYLAAAQIDENKSKKGKEKNKESKEADAKKPGWYSKTKAKRQIVMDRLEDQEQSIAISDYHYTENLQIDIPKQKITKTASALTSGLETKENVESTPEEKGSEDTGLPSFEIPSVSLSAIPAASLPDDVPLWLKNIQLPGFTLTDFPGLDLSRYASYDKVVLPSIDLSTFPGIVLPVDIDINEFKYQLPEIVLSNYPNIVVPIIVVPNIVAPTINANEIISKSTAQLPVKLPKLLKNMRQIKINVGNPLMKVKLFLGFAQCVSFFPITFSSIEFPESFINLGKILELLSFDLLSVFGETACRLQTGFYKGFEFTFSIIPVIVGATLLTFGSVILTHSKKSKYTKESATTRLYSILFLIVYSLYTGVSTKMFRLFKCREIQDVWYLTADYSVKCDGNEYSFHVTLAIIGIVMFTLGIPLFIYIVLFRNRKHLHQSNCPPDELYKQIQIQKKYGSIYR